jgi:nucleoside-diphosphate-sugar epimerase
MTGDKTGRLETLHSVASALSDPDRHFVVTGGGGWLGRAALEILDFVYGAELERRVSVFGASAKVLVLRSGRRIPSRPFTEIENLEKKGPTILHFAYLTRGFSTQMPLGKYLAINRSLSLTVAGVAARHGARGLLLPSSGAVYRKDRTLDHDFATNPYGALKLEDEERFGALAKKHDFPAVVIRIFNLSGPFLNHPCHYALGSILQDIEAGRTIEIRTAHPVIRGYTHVGDLLTLALGLLARDDSAGPLDAGGRPAIEIGSLALRAAQLLGRPKLEIRRPTFPSGPPDIYIGDGTRYEALAEEAGLKLRTIDEQIVETATFLKSAQ